MSEYKHTAGPWGFGRTRDDQRLILGKNGDGRYVCNVQIHQTPRAMGRMSEPEREANARLIAAAPEMLEALLEADKTLCALQGNVADANKRDPRWDGMWDEIQSQRDHMRQAVARATGATDE